MKTPDPNDVIDTTIDGGGTVAILSIFDPTTRESKPNFPAVLGVEDGEILVGVRLQAKGVMLVVTMRGDGNFEVIDSRDDGFHAYYGRRAGEERRIDFPAETPSAVREVVVTNSMAWAFRDEEGA